MSDDTKTTNNPPGDSNDDTGKDSKTDETKKPSTTKKDKGPLLIVNTTARGVECSALPDSDDPEEQEGKTLLPGQNNVSQKYFDFIKKNPAVRMYLEEGDLECHGHKKAVTLSDGLNALSMDEAKKQIKMAASVKLLKDWEDATKSEKLKALIRKRIEKLAKR